MQEHQDTCCKPLAISESSLDSSWVAADLGYVSTARPEPAGGQRSLGANVLPSFSQWASNLLRRRRKALSAAAARPQASRGLRELPRQQLGGRRPAIHPHRRTEAWWRPEKPRGERAAFVLTMGVRLAMTLSYRCLANLLRGEATGRHSRARECATAAWPRSHTCYRPPA